MAEQLLNLIGIGSLGPISCGLLSSWTHNCEGTIFAFSYCSRLAEAQGDLSGLLT
jgi:hypothetical protein